MVAPGSWMEEMTHTETCPACDGVGWGEVMRVVGRCRCRVCRGLGVVPAAMAAAYRLGGEVAVEDARSTGALADEWAEADP